MDADQKFSRLREQALQFLSGQAFGAADEDARLRDLSSALQELRIYHAELELQNQELREVQETLQRSRHQYFSMFHRAPIGYAVLEETGAVRDMNEIASAWLAADGGLARRQPFVRFVAEPYQGRFLDLLQSAFASGGELHCELELVGPERRGLWGELRGKVHLDGEQRQPTLLLAIADISARRRAERELQESEIRYRGIFDSTADGLLIYDLKGRIRDANPAACQVLGRERGDLRGQLMHT